MMKINLLRKKIISYALSCDYQYIKFSILNIIAHPIFYLIWMNLDEQGYNENFLIRLGALLLCVPLSLSKYWPNYLKSNKPFYWYLTVTYCLPIFFTFMLLKNNFSYGWSLNSLTGIILCVLFLDYKSLIILTPLGILIGSILYYVTTPDPTFYSEHLKTIIITYSTAFLFGFLFLRRNDILFRVKYETLKFQSGAIAHEMRTPLANVVMNAKTLERMADDMATAQGWEPTRQARYLSEKSIELRQVAQRLERIAKGSQNFINLLLSNLRQDFDNVALKTLTIQECLDKVLEEFAFKPAERAKVHIDVRDNFTFEGNEDLIAHVFFNLLKNSFYFTQAAGKGEITITARTRETAYEIEFKDTGTGIEPQRLPHLFEAFYSRRPHGTGIGLSFCKKAMESMKGTIQVSSILGEHTTFVLSLPRGKENFAKI